MAAGPDNSRPKFTASNMTEENDYGFDGALEREAEARAMRTMAPTTFPDSRTKFLNRSSGKQVIERTNPYLNMAASSQDIQMNSRSCKREYDSGGWSEEKPVSS